jgi:hypothetical protein
VVALAKTRPEVPSAPRGAPSGGKLQAALAKACFVEELKAALLALSAAACQAVLVMDGSGRMLLLANIEQLSRLVAAIVVARKEDHSEQA